jgi:hypothetical protein
LRHYAAIHKVAGLMPGDVIGVFNRTNPSSRTVALWSTLPLTGMSTRNLSSDKGLPAREPDTVSRLAGMPRRLTTLWASKGYYKGRFFFLFIISPNLSDQVKETVIGMT